MALNWISPKVLLAMFAALMLGALVMVIAQTGTPLPPRLVDPGSAISKGCNIAVTMTDFDFQPGYAADGSLISVLVTKKGVDPNQSWLLLLNEPSYSEFGSTMAWKSAVQNLSGEKGLATKLLRAGDIYLMEKLGARPARQIWDTKNNGFSTYLACAEIIAKATALQDGMPMWSLVPVP